MVPRDLVQTFFSLITGTVPSVEPRYGTYQVPTSLLNFFFRKNEYKECEEGV